MRFFCAAFGALLLSGCVSGYAGSAREAGPEVLDGPGWRSVRSVPVVRQENRLDCGAAALASVLAYFGDPVPRAEIESKVRPAPDRGIRADALRDFAKSRGFESFCVPAERGDLEAEISAGRPVLVGLVKPQIGSAVTHYEVVVGLAPDHRVATIDPARGLTVNSWDGFFEEWSSAGRLAVIIAPKESAPPGASR